MTRRLSCAHFFQRGDPAMAKTKRQLEEKVERKALGNNLTLEELSQIEEMAHRSHSREAAIILRLSAALREALQVRESALALMRRDLH